MANLLNELNPEQAKAVEYIDGPSLVFSGPGSGKTRVITYKIAHLIKEHNVPSENILAVTFTNKAAREMKERLFKLLGNQTNLPWVGTFHSLCAKMLRVDGRAIGIQVNFVIYDTDDQIDLIKEVLNTLNIDPKKFNPHTILNTISSAKNELIGPTDYATFARGYFQEMVAKVYVEYQQYLRRNQALDFDDILAETVKLFRDHPDILARYQERFQFILVDEYQDTNNAQYQLTKMLASKRNKIAVVGDSSQAIYSWRGANYRNIINFQKDFPTAKVFNLEQNYRSTKKILEVAKHVISHNTSHPILDIWTKNDEGNPPIIYEAENEVDEGAFVMRMIEQSRAKLGLDYKDFAILYRTNAQSRTLEESLLRTGMPYMLVGGTRFYERKEVKDVLAYMRLIGNPADSVSLKRIINTPPRGIGPAALRELKNPESQPKIMQFLKLLEELRVKSVNVPSVDVIDLVTQLTGYLTWLNDGTPEGLSRIENVKELRSVAVEFPALDEFLENVALIEREYVPADRPKDNEIRNAVTLMTLHAAKGLEFEVVFIVGLEEGILPHSRSVLEKDQLEEERRLAYVGITRAKRQLYLTYAQSRLYFGARSDGIPSRFLADIPEELILPIRF